MSSSTQIFYSDKYYDDVYEYRHVILPRHLAKRLKPGHLMSREEYLALGVQQSLGWVHYAIHEPEPHVLLFRRPKPKEIPPDIREEGINTKIMEAHRRIAIAYYDEYKIWEAVESGLQKYFPLVDVPWRHRSSTTIVGTQTNTVMRVAPRMQVSIYRLDDPQFESRSRLPVDWHLKPYACLYIVAEEDTDNYRNILKPKLKAWTQSQTDKENEWLIVHVTVGARSLKTELTRKLNRSVFDRLRSDFSTSKRERCSAVRVGEEGEGWAELAERVKECVSSSLEQQVSRYEEELRKLEGRWGVPGWNYCSYFVVREGLAYTLERGGAAEDALKQYDELEAMWLEPGRMPPSARPAFDVFADPTELARSAAAWSLLDVSATADGRPFRELVYMSTVPELDLHRYLFARQARLLFMLDRVEAVAERAIAKLQALCKAIAAVAASSAAVLPRGFAFAFVVAACMEVIEACEAHCPVPSTSPLSLLPAAAPSAPSPRAALNTLLAALYAYARSKLYLLGMELGLCGPSPLESVAASAYRNGPSAAVLPPSPAPARLAGGSPHAADSGPRIPDSIHRRLRHALQSPDEFDKLHIELTRKAVVLFKDAQRDRTVAWLNSELAAAYFQRGRHAEAEVLLKSAVAVYEREGWGQLAHELRGILARCQKTLQHPQEYIASCLALLAVQDGLAGGGSWRRDCGSGNRVGEQPDARREFFASELIAVARHELTAVVVKELKPLLAVSVALTDGDCGPTGRTLCVPLEARVQLDCIVQSTLPVPLAVDKLCVKLVGYDAQLRRTAVERKLVMEVRNLTLAAVQHVRLEKEVHVAGDYILDKAWVELGKLVLAQPLRADYEGALLVRVVPATGPSVSLACLAPPLLLWGELPQAVVVRLATNEDAVLCSSCELKVSVVPSPAAPSMAVEDFPYGLPVVMPRDGPVPDLTFHIANGTIRIRGDGHVPPRSTVEVPMQLRLAAVPLVAQASPSLSPRPTTIHSQHLQVVLTYEKAGGASADKLSVTERALLTWWVPFRVEYSVRQSSAVATARTVCSTVHIQFAVTNDSPAGVCIADYALELPEWSIAHDPNTAVRGSVVPPQRTTYLTFALRRLAMPCPAAGSGAPQKPSLTLLLRLPSACSTHPENVQRLQWAIPWPALAPSIMYSIGCAPPAAPAEVGTLIEVVASITSFQETQRAVQLDIEGLDSNSHDLDSASTTAAQWLIVGRKRFSLTLMPYEPAPVKLLFVPLVAGAIQLPQMTIVGVDPSSVDTSSYAMTVHVAPTRKLKYLRTERLSSVTDGIIN